VLREDHPTDRRAKALTVTPAGRELANRTVTVVEACDAEFFGLLGSPGAIQALVQSLDVLAARSVSRS
jgi:DNA-binding MarR family transcriptional regulator